MKMSGDLTKQYVMIARNDYLRYYPKWWSRLVVVISEGLKSASSLSTCHITSSKVLLSYAYFSLELLLISVMPHEQL